MEGSFLFMQHFEMLRSGNPAKINEAAKLKEKFDKLYRFDQFLFHSFIIIDGTVGESQRQRGLFHTSQGKSGNVRESQGI